MISSANEQPASIALSAIDATGMLTNEWDSRKWLAETAQQDSVEPVLLSTTGEADRPTLHLMFGVRDSEDVSRQVRFVAFL